MKTVSDQIFSYLKQAGVERVFYLPGGGAMFLNDALARSEISSTLCLHEQAVAIAAEYHGRASDQPFGVALVTNGPGATNTLTALAGAYIEGIPLLIISGQVKTEDLKQEKTVRQTGVQEVSTLPMAREVTKYAAIIRHAKDVREELERCLEAMLTGRKGPGWLEVPLNVQAAPIDESSAIARATSFTQVFAYDTKGTEYVLRQSRLFEEERGYSRPLLLVGQGVRQSGEEDAVLRFAVENQIPIATTFPAKDFIEYENSLFVGHPGNVALRAANLAIQNCDLLITLGTSLNNVITAYNPAQFGKNAAKVICDIDEGELRKHRIPDSVLLRSSPAECIEAIRGIEAIDRSKSREWLDFVSGLKRRYSYDNEPAYMQERSCPKEETISLYKAIDALSRVLYRYEYIVTGSSGLCIEAFYMLYRNVLGQRILIDSGLGSMGYGLPALIGTCMARGKGKKTILVEGDGSLQMNIQELAIIAGNKLNCLIVLISNNGYASIKNSQTAYFDGRTIGCDQGSGLYLPDMKRLAVAYGIEYYGARSVSEIEEAEQCVRSKEGPSIIEIFTDKDVVLQPRVKSLKRNDGSMMSLPIEDMYPHLDMDTLGKELRYSGIAEISRELRKS